MHILLVEDNPTDIKLLSAVLKSSGHSVVEEISAEQAVHAIKARRPDLIVLDLKLPGMDGLTLARRLKQDPDLQSIPIVAITAAREMFSKEAALNAGCDAYIAKPVDTRTLSEEVRSAVAPKPGGA